LDKDFIIAEGKLESSSCKIYNLLTFPSKGYKEIKTHREHMATMGDWRKDKDEEMQLDGIGGVNIIVKGDVHRSGNKLRS
jgi:hypothetical protein